MDKLLKLLLLSCIFLPFTDSALAEARMNLWVLRVRTGSELPVPKPRRINNGVHKAKIGNWNCTVSPTAKDKTSETRVLACAYKTGVQVAARVSCSNNEEEPKEVNLALISPFGEVEGGIVLACSNMVVL